MMTEENKLYRFISKTISLSANDFNKIASKINFIDYKKGDFIIKPNQFCNNLSFVLSGIYRVYHIEHGPTFDLITGHLSNIIMTF